MALKRHKRDIKKTLSSDVIIFADKKLSEEYKVFINSPCEIKPQYKPFYEDLPFCKLYYPFQDFCLVLSKDKRSDVKEEIESFSKKESFIFNQIGDAFLLSSRPLLNKDGKQFIFSGTSRYRDKLIVGDEDIDETDGFDPQLLKNQIGEFFTVLFDGKKIEVFSDYLGMLKLFYFKRDDIFIISNQYHLILLLLKKLGFKLSINKQAAMANFCNVRFYLAQSFCSQKEIEEIFILAPYQYISIINNNVSFINGDLYETLSLPPKNCKIQYEQLLFKAKSEVIDNVRIALEHPKFKHLIVDLSGGLDSRMVYAALTNLPDPQNKIIINSSLGKNKEEIEFIDINNLYNYPYEDTEKEAATLDIVNAFSYHLGEYYDHIKNRFHYGFRNPDTLRLTGAIGEFYRDFYSHYYETKDLDVVIKKMISFGAISDIYLSGIPIAFDLFKKELESIPAKDAKTKGDLLYNFFRGRIHFSSAFHAYYMCRWTPLMSKNLLKLFITQRQYDDNAKKIEFDFMKLLNPLIAEIPYGNTRYNLEKKNLNKKLSRYGQNDIGVSIKRDMSKWNNAQELLKQKISYFPDIETYKQQIKSDLDLNCPESALPALKTIIEFNNGVFKDLSFPVFVRLKQYYLKLEQCSNDENKKHFLRLICKIFHLYYQLRFVD